MTDLAVLGDSAAKFAAENDLTLIPVAPDRDADVHIAASVMELPAFLAPAAKLGGAVLYAETEHFDPEGMGRDELPEDLSRRAGEACRFTAAFVANGLVHVWEQSAPWYREWLSAPAPPSQRAQPAEGPLADGKRDAVIQEWVEQIVAMPEFRAARNRGARIRLAEMITMPPQADYWKFDIARHAAERAEEMTTAAYEPIIARLDALAAEVLDVAEYRQASTSRVRKQVIEHFLIPRADGFSAPTVVRDELHAKTQRLAKTGWRTSPR